MVEPGGSKFSAGEFVERRNDWIVILVVIQVVQVVQVVQWCNIIISSTKSNCKLN